MVLPSGLLQKFEKTLEFWGPEKRTMHAMGYKLLYSGFENVSSLVVHPAHASAVRAQSGAKHISGRILAPF